VQSHSQAIEIMVCVFMKYIYVISAGEAQQKIGVAGDPTRRIRELQIGSATRLKLAKSYRISTAALAYTFEREAHRRLSGQALEGEWFAVTVEHALGVLSAVIGDHRCVPELLPHDGWRRSGILFEYE
jgi:hypothetical protein